MVVFFSCFRELFRDLLSRDLGFRVLFFVIFCRACVGSTPKKPETFENKIFEFLTRNAQNQMLKCFGPLVALKTSASQKKRAKMKEVIFVSKTLCFRALFA